LLAQEVQKVFPELVNEDKNGMLSLNYQGLIPILIKALKDQNEIYLTLENQLSAMEKLIKN
jgi:hypothetical protein